VKGWNYLFASVVLVIAATPALSVDVKTDYDRNANFSQYKTYSWAKVEMPDPLWDQRVKESVDKVLQTKGLREVPTGGDLSLVAVGTTKEKQTLQTFYDGFDGWLWSGFGTATTTTETYQVGTMIVDIFDSNTKKLLWRGSASDVLSDKPEKNEKKVEKAVEKMFEHFPPRTTNRSWLPPDRVLNQFASASRAQVHA